MSSTPPHTTFLFPAFPFVVTLEVFLFLCPIGIPVFRHSLFSYFHPDSRSLSARVGMRVGDVGRPITWITIWFLYFKRNKRTESLVKIIMYNATCTHKDVEEYLVPFPLATHSHPMSGPNNRSPRPNYTCSHRPAVACDTDSPKRDCSHWPSLSGVSSDSTHSLGPFRYGSHEELTHKDSQDLLGRI